MKVVARLIGWLRRPPTATAEELAEAQRVQDEMQKVRLSQTRGAGSAGANYQSGRGTRL